MARERILTAPDHGEDEQFYHTLRPSRLADVIGQQSLVEKLRISLEAASQRKEPLEHVLLHGPPGLGKTTLAKIIATELGVPIKETSGPTLTRPADLMGILTNLQPGEVLFIDEIHRLTPAVEEFIYPAIEDFRLDFVTGEGVGAATVNISLNRFTLIGATTRLGLLSAPLRGRFGILHHFNYYPVEDLEQITSRSANLLKLQCGNGALGEIARRARGTPRIANRLLRRARDYAQIKTGGELTSKTADEALTLEGVDGLGLDLLDRQFLSVIMGTYQGGPVGIEAIAATLGEETDTLVDTVEPFLLQIGFLARTRKGRLATDAAYVHLKQSRQASGNKRQQAIEDPAATLFEN